MSTSFTITGLKELNKAMNKYKSSVTEDLGKETKVAAVNIDRNTKKRLASSLKGSLGRLTSSYHIRVSKSPISADVYSNLFYAPFIEFGTGTKVFESNEYTFTAEEKQYAAQFKRGPGRNMPANPALFPSWEEERPEYIKRVRDVLGKRARGA